MDIKWNIGDVIAKLRKAHNLNQTKLAAKVGHNKATIVRVEDGDPKVSREIYQKVATALGTTLAALETEAERLAAHDSRETQRADTATAGTTFPASGTEGRSSGR